MNAKQNAPGKGTEGASPIINIESAGLNQQTPSILALADRRFNVFYADGDACTMYGWRALGAKSWGDLLAWLDLHRPATHKECGGYVLGTFTGSRRTMENLVARSALTLDVDHADPGPGFLDHLAAVLDGVAYAWHTSYSSTPEAPRYRVIVPLDRDVTGSEYRVITGGLVDALGADQVGDKSNPVPVQVMFKPSTANRATYRSGVAEGGALNADVWLRRGLEAGAVMREERERFYDDSPQRPASEGLHPYARAAIDGELAKLDACELLGAGMWDTTSMKVARALVEWGNTRWSGYTPERAEADFMEHAPTDPGFGPREHASKWAKAVAYIDGGGRRPPESDPLEDFAEDFYADGEAPAPASKALPGGWEPVDLGALIDGGLEPLKPSLLARTDGLCLLYPGRTHSLSGESGSGKSWIAQHAAVQALADGAVLYLDYESSAASVVARLRALGASDQLIRERLTYINPAAAPTGEAFDAVLGTSYALAVVDGVTEALNYSGIAGDSLTNNNDALTRWHAMLPKRVATETGAAVLQVDHVTKAKDGRGGYAIGGQAKRAAITGAAYVLRTRESFGRGRPGAVDLLVSKDREGYVLGALSGEDTEAGTLAARAYVRPNHDGSCVEIELEAPESQPVDDGNARMREAVAEFLAGLPHADPGASTNLIKSQVPGKDSEVRKALDALVRGGYVQATKRGQSMLHKLVRPYAPGFEDTA